MTSSSVDIVRRVLSDPTNPAVVDDLVAEDSLYVSLNYQDEDLKKIRHSGAQIILGHLAEGLPFLLPRLEHRLAKQQDGAGFRVARRKVSEYFSDNFYATTSGHFHTRTLFNTIAELGVDRVLFSADYPYETMEEAASWFDNSLLCANDARKIGRDNARRLSPPSPDEGAVLLLRRFSCCGSSRVPVQRYRRSGRNPRRPRFRFRQIVQAARRSGKLATRPALRRDFGR